MHTRCIYLYRCACVWIWVLGLLYVHLYSCILVYAWIRYLLILYKEDSFIVVIGFFISPKKKRLHWQFNKYAKKVRWWILQLSWNTCLKTFYKVGLSSVQIFLQGFSYIAIIEFELRSLYKTHPPYPSRKEQQRKLRQNIELNYLFLLGGGELNPLIELKRSRQTQRYHRGIPKQFNLRLLSMFRKYYCQILL